MSRHKLRGDANPVHLVIFGATGNLATNKLLPALYHLERAGRLHAQTRITAFARRDWDDTAWQAHVRETLEKKLPHFDAVLFKRFAERLGYVRGELHRAEDYPRLREVLARPGDGACTNFVYYLAIKPADFPAVIANLDSVDLNKPRGLHRIVVEKPFGEDIESAEALNRLLHRHFDEEQVYRIDHYLGKETVQNLLALRFANILLEPLWNAQHIAHIEITVAETVGIEGRGDFYDSTGAIRDMVQNHMLQLLALVAMEPPGSFDATSIRDEKVKVLRALRAVAPEDVVTGQYRAGAVGGAAVAGYAEDLGRESSTESFVALKAHVDNWRWKGVPFFLRTGKRMPERKTEIIVQFRPIPHSIFAGQGAASQPNSLIIGIQPRENVRLNVMAKVPGLDRGGVRLREVPLDISMPDAFAGPKKRIAYERLLLDLIEGDQTLFVRRDEVEAQWTWIDAIRTTWAEYGITPKPYTAGSWGPAASVALTERAGVTWHE